MVNVLNVPSDQFHEIWWGRATFVLCPDDEQYEVGNSVVVKATDAKTQQPTGRECTRRLSCILRGPVEGLMEGYAVLGLKTM